MKTIGYITTIIVTMVFGSIWNGYVLSVLWAWFIVKPFNAPPLTTAIAIGIAMVVSYVTYQKLPDTSLEKEKSAGTKLAEGVLWTIIKPAFALGFGAIVKQWI